VIPFDYISEWRVQAPWPTEAQVEQDLILSRAVATMFQLPEVAESCAFRGGSALYKLHVRPAARYSEDIDLVQIVPGPVGLVLDAIRKSLDPWLGTPRRTIKEDRVVLAYRAISEGQPSVQMRLKIEIYTREHFSVFGIEKREFRVHSRWFEGAASVRTYQLDELLGTKLRALYQRKKGRDLFDLHLASRRSRVNAGRVVKCFQCYLAHEGGRVTRAELELNLERKLADSTFLSDLDPLIAPGIVWNPADAADYLRREVFPRLPGSPPKRSSQSRHREDNDTP